MSHWKDVWNRHIADTNIIENGTDKEILLELKRAIGNDVIGGGIPYEGLLDEYQELKVRLCKKVKALLLFTRLAVVREQIYGYLKRME